jgi:hypothetical protein
MEPPILTQLLRSESGQDQDINIGSPKERQVLQLIVRTFPQAGEAVPPESQFDCVLQHELPQIQRACTKVCCLEDSMPLLSIIICGKGCVVA